MSNLALDMNSMTPSFMLPLLSSFRADDCGVHGRVLLELHLHLRHIGLPLRLRRPRGPLQVHHTEPLEGPLNTERIDPLCFTK